MSLLFVSIVGPGLSVNTQAHHGFFSGTNHLITRLSKRILKFILSFSFCNASALSASANGDCKITFTHWHGELPFDNGPRLLLLTLLKL